MAETMNPTGHTPSETPSAGASPSTGSPERQADTGGVVEDAKQVGGELFAAVRDSAVGMMDEQRRTAADQIAAWSGALRNSASSFEQDSGLPLSRYADEAAQRIDSLATAVRSHSWRELAEDVEDFARRWPLLYLSAAVGLGMLAGRLLLAPQPSSSTPSRTQSPLQSESSPGISGAGQRTSTDFNGGGSRASRENG